MKDLSVELKVALVVSLVLLGVVLVLSRNYNVEYPIFDIENNQGDYLEFEYADRVDKLRYIEYRVSEYNGDASDKAEIVEMLNILSEDDYLVSEMLWDEL